MFTSLEKQNRVRHATLDAMISVAEPVAGAPSGLFDRRLSQTASRPDWIGSRVAQALMPLSPVPRPHPLPALPSFQQAPIRPHGRRRRSSPCHTRPRRRRFVLRAAAACGAAPDRWLPGTRAPPIPTLKYGEAHTAAMDAAVRQAGRVARLRERPPLVFRFGCGGAAGSQAIRAGDSILSPLNPIRDSLHIYI